MIGGISNMGIDFHSHYMQIIRANLNKYPEKDGLKSSKNCWGSNALFLISSMSESGG